jgi:hypothetical protein
LLIFLDKASFFRPLIPYCFRNLFKYQWQTKTRSNSTGNTPVHRSATPTVPARKLGHAAKPAPRQFAGISMPHPEFTSLEHAGTVLYRWRSRVVSPIQANANGSRRRPEMIRTKSFLVVFEYRLKTGAPG